MLDKCIALKKRLRARELTFGAWMSFADIGVAEIMAEVGYDWVLIDTEHAPFTSHSLESVLMAFGSRPTVPIVRVPWNDRVFIKHALDLGAGGILVPYVCSVEEARQAVAACKYPLQGIRGFGPRRASDYYRNSANYIRLANEALIVGLQIEHIDAVRAVREILNVPGIDVIVLGPMDLSASMGLIGQLDHPQVVEAIELVVAEAHQAGITVGIPVDAPPEVVSRWVQKGEEFIFVAEDHSMLRRAAEKALANLVSAS